MYFILAQLVGAFAYFLISYSFYKDAKNSILFYQILAYLVFAIHYYMLDAMTGVVTNLMGLLSILIIYIFEKKRYRRKDILSLFVVPLVIIISLITYDNIFSIFPIIAASVSIISLLHDNKNLIRIVGVISATSWLIYAIVYNSYISIVFEVVTAISTFIAYLKKKKASI